MKSLLVILVALLSVFGIPVDDSSSLQHPKWIEWKLRHKKVYKNVKEETVRNFIWQENLHQIVKHNKDSNSSFKMDLNHLSDMTLNELKESVTGCYKIPTENIVNGKLKKHPNATTFLKPSNVKVPAAIDWRQYGYVTPIKNQGQCGSCWAFSSTGSLEGQHFRKTGQLVSLSEQNLVDCCTANAACNGGWMDNSFSYILNNNGIDTEASYPYYARALGYCYFKAQYVGATDTGFVDIASGDESALQMAVASVGPISVAIDATHASFQSYKSGVYYEPACGNTLSSLDHAVLVVGYGVENGYPYWLVKNSWGTWWGENGYIKMLRNYNNMCGIALKASYPLV